jgi:hypothetical protein
VTEEDAGTGSRRCSGRGGKGWRPPLCSRRKVVAAAAGGSGLVVVVVVVVVVDVAWGVVAGDEYGRASHVPFRCRVPY